VPFKQLSLSTAALWYRRSATVITSHCSYHPQGHDKVATLYSVMWTLYNILSRHATVYLKPAYSRLLKLHIAYNAVMTNATFISTPHI
jgi:hypothetical protein